MASNEIGAGTMTSADLVRKQYARKSHVWNKEQKQFQDIFPDMCTEEIPLFGGLTVAPKPIETSNKFNLGQANGAGSLLLDSNSPGNTLHPKPSSGSSLLLRYRWYILCLSVWLYLFVSRIASRLSSSE
jgi:hypothetical protein